VLTHFGSHLECKQSHFKSQPLTTHELWRLELPVLQSRFQCLRLLFLFEVSPLVHPETAPTLLTGRFATSSKRCLMYPSACPGGAISPLQYRICSNGRVLLPENWAAWRQCHLTAAVCVSVVTCDAFFVCFPV
jgi:hypothetical protein